MIRLPIPCLALALAACSQQPDAANEAERAAKAVEPPAASPTPGPTATPAASSAAVLPQALLGTWTADKAGKCAAGTELRILVEADRIRFHESDARVTSVTQVDPHSWGVDAEFTGEGETWTRSFDLNLNEDGTMTRVEAPVPDITYTRCRESGR